MKHFLVIFLCLIFTINASFSFPLFKKKQKEETSALQTPPSGYNGTLPNIEDAFDIKREKLPPKSIHNYDVDLEKETLKKIPLDNSKYVEIILKNSDPSDFILDLRDIIVSFEKMKKNLDTDRNLQFFNAQVASLINNVNYFQDKYWGHKEYSKFEHEKVIELCNRAREIAISNSQKQLYKQYIPESDKNYSIQNLSYKMQRLSLDIGDIIVLLKNIEAK